MNPNEKTPDAGNDGRARAQAVEDQEEVRVRSTPIGCPVTTTEPTGGVKLAARTISLPRITADRADDRMTADEIER